MQPFQHYSLCPAARVDRTTHADAAQRNLDAATPLQSSEAEFESTIELRSMATEIVAPKLDPCTEASRIRLKYVSSGKLPAPKITKHQENYRPKSIFTRYFDMQINQRIQTKEARGVGIQRRFEKRTFSLDSHTSRGLTAAGSFRTCCIFLCLKRFIRNFSIVRMGLYIKRITWIKHATTTVAMKAVVTLSLTLALPRVSMRFALGKFMCSPFGAELLQTRAWQKSCWWSHMRQYETPSFPWWYKLVEYAVY